MSWTRAVAILLVFFAILFYFRVPVQSNAGAFTQDVLTPVQDFFHRVAGATSSIPGYSVLPGATGTPYPQAVSTTTKSKTATSTATTDSKTEGTSTSVSVDKLPPVQSDIAPYDSSALTINGIISLTNKERTSRGLQPLTHNSTLDKSAEAKLEDMFNKQYFEHVSPSGVSVSDLVTQEGYQYIVVGENLALGNFGGDANVMSAWMNSPGHRANILDTRYQDIGVAVGRGMYQGKMQWLAVQHFGKPLSSCPQVDSQLKSSIDSAQTDLTAREKQLNDLKAQIDNSNPSDPSYQTNVDQYNQLAQEYNQRLETFKTAVDQYNQSVDEFNKCAGLTS